MTRRTSFLVLLTLLAAAIAVAQPMSGVYTVKQEGGGDFLSIDEAIDALELRRFDGDVQFDVYGGTYVGTYWLISNSIGNGPNWLTFRAYPGEKVILDAGGNSCNWNMIASRRIRIEGFEMTGATYCGLNLDGWYEQYSGCDTCVIRNNTITAPTGIYDYYADDDTIDGNTIYATVVGIWLQGYGFGTPEQYNVRNVVINNTLSGFAGSGIFANGQNSLRIKDNTFTGGFPIWVNSGSYDTIANNVCHSTGDVGMIVAGYPSSPYSQGLVVANNMVDGAGFVGIELCWTNGAKLVYNSVQCPDGSYAGMFSDLNYALEMKDNIFLAGSCAMLYGETDGAYLVSSDNNGFRRADGGSEVIYHFTYGPLDLATWRSKSGMDANSIDADPGFKSATDEHLLPTSPCIGAGAPFPGILTDIDGDQRSTSMPCIGADECALPPGWAEMAPLPGLVWTGGWLAHKPGDRHVYAARGDKSGDFYRYDIMSNSWSSLAAIPAWGNDLPDDGSRGVRDGGDFVYATTGNGCPGFWRYNIADNLWEGLEDVPANLAGGTDLVHVPGTPDHIYLIQGKKGRFLRYDVALNHWSDLGKAPPAGSDDNQWKPGSFMTFDGDHTIYAHRSYANELWTYDVATGSWGNLPLNGMPPDTSKDGGCGDWYDGGIYALKGTKTNEFWHWDAGTRLWDALDPFLDGKVDNGADIVSHGNGTFYALKGGKTAQFLRYVPYPSQGGGSGDQEIGSVRLVRALALDVSPNPMRVGAAIRYSVPAATNVSIKLYDITGAVARTVTGGVAQPGWHTAHVSAKGLARGVYILKLASDACSVTRKVVIE